MKTQLTIEQSQKLIELGVDAKLASEREFIDKTERDSNQFLEIEEYPRFTLTDILSILPKEIDGYHLNIEASDDGYDVAYILYDRNDGLLFLGATPTAPELIDALNHLLIWAITSGHYKTAKK